MSETTYEFDYAMKRLRDAIDYADQVADFQQVRLWAARVEAAYNADIKAEQELTANATAGAKLIYNIATGKEVAFVNERDTHAEPAAPVDEIDALAWQNYPDFEDQPKEEQPKIDFNLTKEEEF